MIVIKKQGILSKVGDLIMLPIMYFVQGNVYEVPQKTHMWNYQTLRAPEIQEINPAYCVELDKDPSAIRQFTGLIPFFHMPIFGGWKNFVVLEPLDTVNTYWNVGWTLGNLVQVSRIQITQKVRLLTPPLPVQFFGIDSNGTQIQIQTVGHGKVGEAREYAKVPLL
jgi:hypothetical protein